MQFEKLDETTFERPFEMIFMRFQTIQIIVIKKYFSNLK
jgi:hypothetical protein